MSILPDVPGVLGPRVPAAACPQTLSGSYTPTAMPPGCAGWLVPRSSPVGHRERAQQTSDHPSPLPWFLGPFPWHWPSTSSPCRSQQNHGDPGRCLCFSLPCSRCQHLTCLPKATWHPASRETPLCGVDRASEPLGAGDLQQLRCGIS